jgi:hypothetical protein
MSVREPRSALYEAAAAAHRQARRSRTPPQPLLPRANVFSAAVLFEDGVALQGAHCATCRSQRHSGGPRDASEAPSASPAPEQPPRRSGTPVGGQRRTASPSVSSVTPRFREGRADTRAMLNPTYGTIKGNLLAGGNSGSGMRSTGRRSFDAPAHDAPIESPLAERGMSHDVAAAPNAGIGMGLTGPRHTVYGENAEARGRRVRTSFRTVTTAPRMLAAAGKATRRTDAEHLLLQRLEAAEFARLMGGWVERRVDIAQQLAALEYAPADAKVLARVVHDGCRTAWLSAAQLQLFRFFKRKTSAACVERLRAAGDAAVVAERLAGLGFDAADQRRAARLLGHTLPVAADSAAAAPDAETATDPASPAPTQPAATQ